MADALMNIVLLVFLLSFQTIIQNYMIYSHTALLNNIGFVLHNQTWHIMHFVKKTHKLLPVCGYLNNSYTASPWILRDI